MRNWMIAAVLILSLAACDRGSDRAQASARTLSIQTSEPASAPVVSKGGKLAVLPDEPSPHDALVASTAVAEAPSEQTLQPAAQAAQPAPPPAERVAVADPNGN